MSNTLFRMESSDADTQCHSGDTLQCASQKTGLYVAVAVHGQDFQVKCNTSWCCVYYDNSQIEAITRKTIENMNYLC